MTGPTSKQFSPTERKLNDMVNSLKGRVQDLEERLATLESNHQELVDRLMGRHSGKGLPSKKNTYRREYDPGDGSGVQVFEGATMDELADKLAVAHMHATKKIRELSTERIGPQTREEQLEVIKEFIRGFCTAPPQEKA